MVVDFPVPGPVFRVLGPFEVAVAGRQVPVPAGAQRSLLALLLLSRGRAVTTGRLLEGLWAEEQPQDPRGALHTTVARLRRTLGDAGGAVRTVAPGYVLDIGREAVDADRFADLLTRARVLLRGGRPTEVDPAAAHEAAGLIRAALGLWRGAAWAEFADGFASGEALSLEEARLAGQEDLAAALLASGQPAEAVAVLESLVLEHPLRDRAVGLLVDALHRYGRTVDALTVYGSYRDRLADELGLDPPPEVLRLHQRVLRQEVPAPTPPPPIRPRPRTSTRPRSPDGLIGGLVGREAEADDLQTMLARDGLVTLVGPGGVGKTELARHVAAGGGRPCRWVDLAPVRDRAGVVQAVADALGLETRSGTATEAALAQRLASAADLVVLDNCEQVLDDVAAVLTDTGASRSGVLATSRERLGIPGERVFVVEPLGLPEPGAADEAAPAVALFLSRAQEAGAALSGPEVLRRVGDVCRALDGLPLAVELGAARMGTLTLDDLADRLDRRFEVLTRGPRTAPRRHQTLRSVVDWSYDLLEPEEKMVFTRLSVFPAGFDLDAAEAVATGPVPAEHVADLVAQLAGRSMVVRPSPTGRGRYRLLETLRQYAASRLEADEVAAVRRRHALWALQLAEDARRGLEGPAEGQWTRLLDEALPDLRAAWRWSVEAHEWQVSERLVAATWRWAHWRLRADVLGWGATLLTIRDEHAPVVAYTAAAGRAWVAGDLDEAQRIAALAEHRHPDVRHRADLFEILGDVHLARSDPVLSLDNYTRAERLRAESGDRLAEAIVMGNEVLALTYASPPEKGGAEQELRRAVTRTVEAAAALENPSAVAFAHYAEGEALAEHDATRALAALERAVSIADEVENRLIAGIAMTALVALRAREAPVESATFELFGRVIDHWATTRSPQLLITAVRNLVLLLGRAGSHDAAVELWSAVHSIDGGHPTYGIEADRLDSALSAARAAMGASFREAELRGHDHQGPAAVAALAARLCADRFRSGGEPSKAEAS